jgi:arylsulfatase A
MSSYSIPRKAAILAGLLILSAFNCHGEIIAGWHSPDVNASAANDSTPDVAEIAGVSALLSGGADVQSNEGSTDGSFGPEPIPGSPSTANRIRAREGDSVQLTITNNTSGGLALDRILFDYDGFANAPKDVAITYSSGSLDDSPGTPVFSAQNVVLNVTLQGDFPDYSVVLADSLTDTTLGVGESATFVFNFSNANTTNSAGALDNVAVVGRTVIDEPEPEPEPEPRTAVATVRKPNVVIFYADDIGLGDISASGFATTEISTPNIDALADQGMRFTDAHTAFATCAPSRYALLSGNMPFRGRKFNGTWGLQDLPQFRSGQRSMGHLFQDAGYRTAHIGKTHLGGGLSDASGNAVTGTDVSAVDWLKGIRNGPNSYLGFDYSFISHDGIQGSLYVYHENEFPVTGFSFDAVTDTWSWSPATTQAFKFLQAGSPSNPATGTIDLDPDGNGVDSDFLYDTGKNSIYGYGDFDTTKAGEIYLQAAKNFISEHTDNHPDTPFYMHYASQAVHVPHTPDTTFFDDPVRMLEKTPHLDMVREMDIQLRMLVEHLEAEGVANDTIIIFTSDNGGLRHSLDKPNQLDAGDTVQHDGSGPFRGNKGGPYEGGNRVPFIVRWGDGTPDGSVIPPGSVCDKVISQMDLLPTFAALLNLPQPSTQALDGMNVLPYFFGQFDTTIRDHLLAASSYQNAYSYSYRLGDWKIITADPGRSNNGNIANHSVVELYNMAIDPYESTDLATDPAYASIRDSVFASLAEKISSGRATLPQDADGDGLFDDWERHTAGNLSTWDAGLLVATADSDGDGLSDSSEYRLRSNPLVYDALGFQASLQLENGQFVLKWPSNAGVFYQIEQSSNLSTWNFLPGVFPGVGQPIQLIGMGLDPLEEFFRITVAP